ncbi:hypothetical protein DH2020_033993 [Rehmannia glutinosa]|uniref:Reverse transcriptase Ty1/copia-type domain-containing protein n=1 Tax=Rehmannia glutinosa TaxID=99300 RepID=A0ABR0VAR9_REHGL
MQPSPGVAHQPGEVCKLHQKSTTNSRILLALYVDDMIILGDDIDGIETLKSALARSFAMKYLCPHLRYFLGIEVASSPGLSFVSIKVYSIYLSVHDIDSKIVDTPLETNARYSPFDGSPLLDPVYIACCWRFGLSHDYSPDILHIFVHVVSQFVLLPSTVHHMLFCVFLGRVRNKMWFLDLPRS